MFLVSYLKHMQRSIFLTQLIFTCSMSTIETLEKNMKYVQGTNVTIKHQNDVNVIGILFLNKTKF